METANLKRFFFFPFLMLSQPASSETCCLLPKRELNDIIIFSSFEKNASFLEHYYSTID